MFQLPHPLSLCLQMDSESLFPGSLPPPAPMENQSLLPDQSQSQAATTFAVILHGFSESYTKNLIRYVIDLGECPDCRLPRSRLCEEHRRPLVLALVY